MVHSQLDIRLANIMLCLFLLVAGLFGSAIAQQVDNIDELVAANYKTLVLGNDAALTGDCENSLSILSAAASDDVFWRHSEEVRKNIYGTLALCAVRLEQHERSIPYIEAVIELDSELASRWLQQLVTSGIVLEHLDIAVNAVVRLAALDIDALGEMDVHILFQLHGLLNGHDVSGELKFAFLEALHEADFSPKHPFYTADGFMIDYAIMLANQGKTSGVRDIVLALTEPGVLVRVLVDRRFDIVSQDPDLVDFLNLNAAADREIERMGRLVEQYPEYAIGALYHSRALTAAWRFEDSLAAIETVALKLGFPFNLGGYVDLDEAKPWVMAEYSAALWRLEYGEHSGAMYIEALEPPKIKGQNINQIINIIPRALYGGFLQEAHDIARQVDLSLANPYGRMWVHASIVCVNVMGPKISDYTESEAFLLEHERYNPAALTLSLMCKNDMLAAGQQMTRRVDDPELRMSALLSMQYTGSSWELERREHHHSSTNELTPGHILWHRYDELRSRDDVLRAVNRVGRLIEVPIHHSVWHRY